MTKRKRTRLHVSRRIRLLSLEKLESRFALALNAIADTTPSPAWFVSFDSDSTAAIDLHRDEAVRPSRIPFVGPRLSDQMDWVVRLTTVAATDQPTFSSIDNLLSSSGIEFETVRGLGISGLLQVRSFAKDAFLAESALSNNVNVASSKAMNFSRATRCQTIQTSGIK